MGIARGTELASADDAVQREGYQSLPEITHYQFLIIDILSQNKEVSGPHLRAIMKSSGISRKHNAFYKAMGRLESCNYVEGRDDTEHQSRGIPERIYIATPEGIDKMKDTIDFYETRKALRDALDNKSA